MQSLRPLVRPTTARACTALPRVAVWHHPSGAVLSRTTYRIQVPDDFRSRATFRFSSSLHHFFISSHRVRALFFSRFFFLSSSGHPYTALRTYVAAGWDRRGNGRGSAFRSVVSEKIMFSKISKRPYDY